VVVRSLAATALVPSFVIVFAPSPQTFKVGVVVVLAFAGRVITSSPVVKASGQGSNVTTSALTDPLSTPYAGTRFDWGYFEG
jgi:hypothetical protein